jgi:putative redox protein
MPEEQTRGRKQPMVITHDGGLRFVANIRGHRVETDQPERAGGADSGPMPLELLGASLGTCIALFVHQFCAAREIATEGLQVELTTQGAQEPPRIGVFHVRLTLPAGFPDRYRGAVERVARSCTVHNTLVGGAGLEVELV